VRKEKSILKNWDTKK